MIQVEDTRITINCSCEWPYHRLYAEYEPEDDNPLMLAVIVHAPTFLDRLKAAYLVLTKGQTWLSEIYLDKNGSEVFRQFLNNPHRARTTITGTSGYMGWNVIKP